MTHRVRSALGRFLALGAAAAIALFVAIDPAAAQQTTGKIQGTVTDQAGVPLASAQVLVVGTSFGAVTNDQGYYFINNVPVGTYTVRAQFIGYAPTEVREVRVFGGQTITQDVKLTPSAIQVGGVSVEAAVNPIVPRDQVTSKDIVSGQLIDRLPVENTREALILEPGVVESGNGKGVSIRGGRPGEAAVYVDGVLVRNSQAGMTSLEVGTNAVEEASITTGAFGAEFGEAQSGILSLVTKSGGQRYSGAFSYQTDDIGFNAWRNVGYRKVEGSFGGPIPGLNDLTFFLATTLTGQMSADAALDRDTERPIYVMSGVDTVVAQPVTVDDPLSDTVNVAIPRFVQYSGYCDKNANFGFECQGLRLPFSAQGSATANAKLRYSFGAGSQISLSGLASQGQNRNLPLTQLYNPQAQTGTRNTSLAGILNWTQNLRRSSERAMALDVYLSYQQDKVISGPLTRQSELDTRDPFGGFLLSPMDFLIDFNSTHDVTIAGQTYTGVRYLDDRQVQCLQAGQQYCRDDVPFLERNDLLYAQPYRMNPYGVEQSARQPMWTQGIEVGPFLERENRFQGRANLDWQVDRYNRVKLGGEMHTFDTRRFTSGMVSPFGMSAYHEKPIRYGAYAEDRLDLGDVVLVGGVRYDVFDSRSSFPYTPGRISSDTLPFDPNNPTANYIPAARHTAWSPKVQVSFPVTEHSNFRLSYGHQVQAPDFNLLFQAKNTDLLLTNQNQRYGRDLDFTKSIIFEFGIRHAFSQDMVLDISAYNKDKVSDVAGRLYQLPDPFRNGATSDFRVFTNADFGNVRGLDVKLDRRFSNVFSGSVAYTFQIAKATGSDPNSYFNTLARQISTLTGETSPPPQAILPTDDNRTHNVAGSAALTLPSDWRRGTTLGTVLSNTSAFVTFRFASGLPYTRVRNQGEGVTPGGFGLEANPIEPINSSSMPWYKNVDLRVTRGFRMGQFDWTLFAEARNLFNWKNVISLFTETGDVVNEQVRKRYVDDQVQILTQEASRAGLLGTDPASGRPMVDLSQPGICASWQGRNTAGSAASGPVDCVLLTRAEARFGNGDGQFTESEYLRAFNAWYNLGNAPDRFYGVGRRIRVGAELSF